jgi:hypothetical protein
MLGDPHYAAQCKPLITPFREKFDANPNDVLQHIALFANAARELEN